MFCKKYVHDGKKYGFYLLGSLLTIACAYTCFARLGFGRIQNWDEARHGVNAYEMMKNRNYIVNTFRNQNDYFNLKPPVSYWGIILGFRMFGTTAFGMRFYAALSMFLTFVIVAFWLYKKGGKTACISSMLFFLTFHDIFYWHAARNADADALYILLFTIGCLNLIESIHKPGRLVVCGLLFSLCFLTKSWHACVLLPIGGLFMLFTGMLKKCRLRHYALLAVSGLGPILFWAWMRYRYDGTAFLGQMFGVDVADRLAWSAGSNAGYGFFVRYLLGDSSFLIMMAVIMICALFLLSCRFRQRCRGELTVSPTALALALWIIIPLVVFSLSHTYYNWYIYPVYPALCISASLLAEKCVRSCSGKKQRLIFALVMLIPFLAALHNARITVLQINDLEYSGFQRDLQNAMERYPQCRGMEIYVEKGNNEYKAVGCWEQAEILAAQLGGDLTCVDGGAKAFLASPGDALLMADPYVYARYQKELEPYPVLYQNEYILLGTALPPEN